MHWILFGRNVICAHSSSKLFFCLSINYLNDILPPAVRYTQIHTSRQIHSAPLASWRCNIPKTPSEHRQADGAIDMTIFGDHIFGSNQDIELIFFNTSAFGYFSKCEGFYRVSSTPLFFIRPGKVAHSIHGARRWRRRRARSNDTQSSRGWILPTRGALFPFCLGWIIARLIWRWNAGIPWGLRGSRRNIK